MKFVSALLILLLGACALAPASEKNLTTVGFDQLPGWNEDRQSEALAALARSCGVLSSRKEWKNICTALPQTRDDEAARTFFTRYFQPYSVNDGVGGLFTGYYEPELQGSLRSTKRYSVPLYARPKDLINVDLGAFNPEFKGRHIAGKVSGLRLVPYDDRAAIAGNSLKGRAHVLLWLDDPVDAFFLEVQGSGRVKLPNGKIVHVGYDGANGRAYIALGRVLADVGAIERPVTMEKIRDWLATHSDRTREVMGLNPSYVFFHIITGDGPIGAEGVALTPKRSLAVDPVYVPLGTPVWLDTVDAEGAVLQRLVVAQDTGGAIKGAVRGDFFWGAGFEAAREAGGMQSAGRYYILLPKAADAP